MKGFLCGFLALVLCCSLSGCGMQQLHEGYVERFGMLYIEIATDSMEPTFSSGETIVCEKVEDPKTLEVGDIIAYWTVIDGKRALNVHRICAVYDMGDGIPLFSTKGDNNVAADPLNVHAGNVVGVYVRKAFWGVY